MDWHREVFNSHIVAPLRRFVCDAVRRPTKRKQIMRNAMLAILALLAGGTAVIAGSVPAAAEIDYPWCVKGSGSVGASGDCSYSTLAQCQASASGRWNLYCGENIRVLFARQAQQQQGVQPQPRRRQQREY
jgi:Protein of unknown function (DUF3551)